MKRPSDSDFDAELRAELMRSRRAGHDYDVLGNLPQLRTALEAAQTQAGDPALTAEGHESVFTGAGAVPTWKLIVIAATVGVGAVVAWSFYARQTNDERSAASEQPAPRVPPPAAPIVQPQLPKPVSAVTDETVEASSSVEALERKQPTSSARREISQLVRIRELLERDPAAAYRLGQQHAREFPLGVLSEERQALQVLALAKLGVMDDAVREAQAFFARYPQSPMRKRIDAALRRD